MQAAFYHNCGVVCHSDPHPVHTLACANHATRICLPFGA